MSDIVRLLRDIQQDGGAGRSTFVANTVREAANEIVRLRKLLQLADAKLSGEFVRASAREVKAAIREATK